MAALTPVINMIKQNANNCTKHLLVEIVTYVQIQLNGSCDFRDQVNMCIYV